MRAWRQQNVRDRILNARVKNDEEYGKNVSEISRETGHFLIFVENFVSFTILWKRFWKDALASNTSKQLFNYWSNIFFSQLIYRSSAFLWRVLFWCCIIVIFLRSQKNRVLRFNWKWLYAWVFLFLFFFFFMHEASSASAAHVHSWIVPLIHLRWSRIRGMAISDVIQTGKTWLRTCNVAFTFYNCCDNMFYDRAMRKGGEYSRGRSRWVPSTTQIANSFRGCNVPSFSFSLNSSRIMQLFFLFYETFFFPCN